MGVAGGLWYSLNLEEGGGVAVKTGGDDDGLRGGGLIASGLGTKTRRGGAR